MTSYSLRNASPAKTRADAVVIGVVKTAKGVAPAPGSEEVVSAYGRKFRPLLATLGLTGKAGEKALVPTGDQVTTPLLVIVGLGDQDKLGPNAVRQAAGVAARAVTNAASVALALPADSPELVRAATEGFLLGGYTFTTYQRDSLKPDTRPGEIVVLSPAARTQDANQAFELAQVLADAVITARDWVNEPPGDLTPPMLADRLTEAHAAATKDADAPKLTIKVLDEKALAKGGYGGIIGVGKGSDAPPRLVQLNYTPDEPKAHVALVGKGITFDSGGLTIKPSGSMPEMKSDMAGAAAVAQATLAIAKLGLPVRISAYLPLAENMISGSAMRPGDVITIYGGRTVEIANTDAEGRLILADALHLATEAEPDVIIDVATLTGHMVAALGTRMAGVMGSDDIVGAVTTAAESAGEAFWPLPIPPEMTERVHSSKIADLSQHDWVRWGGALFAAAFLREFTGEVPWAHLDIAGPAFNSGAAWGHVTSGGTGFAITTLVDYARGLAEA
ncbi:leucyl aminopeptidase [Nocardioides speluncae]|uniref:leucyl aminopeptidase n=1 Tax=Nocardioides speluncae TaxID=2670337 RepID=UPI000D68D5DB|nr:leucyl aminopeptidase [Nocardioides speluncae]